MSLFRFNVTGNVPNIPRTFQVHQIKKEWSETSATSSYRTEGVEWSSPYLALDGSDADAITVSTVNSRESKAQPGYIEFDITQAVQNWVSNDQPNYGVMIYATNEHERGLDVRFYSRESESGRQPMLVVSCSN